MKKILSIILVLTMCLSLFTGCKKEPQQEQTSLAAAAEYLFTMYKDASPATYSTDYQVVSVVKIGTETFQIAWTASVGEEFVKIVPGEALTTIDVNNEVREDVAYTLTATLKDADGNTATVNFERNTPGAIIIDDTLTQAELVEIAKPFLIKDASQDVLVDFTLECDTNTYCVSEIIETLLSLHALDHNKAGLVKYVGKMMNIETEDLAANADSIVLRSSSTYRLYSQSNQVVGDAEKLANAISMILDFYVVNGFATPTLEAILNGAFINDLMGTDFLSLISNENVLLLADVLDTIFSLSLLEFFGVDFGLRFAQTLLSDDMDFMATAGNNGASGIYNSKRDTPRYSPSLRRYRRDDNREIRKP